MIISGPWRTGCLPVPQRYLSSKFLALVTQNSRLVNQMSASYASFFRSTANKIFKKKQAH